MHYERPTKAEREQRNKKLGIGIVLIFVFASVVLVVYSFAQYYYTVTNGDISFDDWNSSSGSFWGAVLGALIAGIATVCTTILVIQRSYKIDYHRERLEVLPVINMQILCEFSGLDPLETEQKLNSDYPGTTIIIPPGVVGCCEDVRLYSLKNVGRGIAYNIKSSGFFCSDWEEMSSFGILPPNEKLILITDLNYHEEIFLSFFDLYENKYQQKFKINVSNNQTVVTAYPPELVKKTERIRYTQ